MNRNSVTPPPPEGSPSTYGCSSKPSIASESHAHLLSPTPRTPNDDAADDPPPLPRSLHPKLVLLHVADIGSEGGGGGRVHRADVGRGKNFSPRKTTLAEVHVVNCSLFAQLTRVRSCSIRHCLLQQLWMQKQQQQQQQQRQQQQQQHL